MITQRGNKSRRHLLQGTLLIIWCLIPLQPHAETPFQDVQDDEVLLPLPRWSEEEMRRFRARLPDLDGTVLQGGGQAADFNVLIRPLPESAPNLGTAFNDHGDISPRLQPEDMGLFLPDALIGHSEHSRSAPRMGPVALAALRDVPTGFLTACSHSLPQDFIIDPDVLVPEMEHQDMMRFLEFHARESRIKLYILIISHDSKLPADADLNEIASGSLLRTNSCLLVYPLGEPWRARLFVSLPVHEKTSHAFLSETAQACLSEALLSSDEFDQLHRYTVQLSTRLFWMQRALPTDATSSGAGQVLAEVSPQNTKPPPPPTGLVTMLIAGLVAAVMVMVSGIAFYRLRMFMIARHRRGIWILPEPETLPRLGGAFTGGAGGTISF